jgi:hypothetical protein
VAIKVVDWVVVVVDWVAAVVDWVVAVADLVVVSNLLLSEVERECKAFSLAILPGRSPPCFPLGRPLDWKHNDNSTDRFASPLIERPLGDRRVCIESDIVDVQFAYCAVHAGTDHQDSCISRYSKTGDVFGPWRVATPGAEPPRADSVSLLVVEADFDA